MTAWIHRSGMQRLRRRRGISPTLMAISLLLACGETDNPRDEGAPPDGNEVAARHDSPGTRQTGPNRWDAVIYTYNWGFEPEEIRVPQGAEVTFRITSRDDFHGFILEGTGLRISAVAPGFATGTHTFPEAGTYPFVCDTYCGAGHYTMEGRVVVEPTAD
ncbi:MAG: cupredoxin domain-containing protein [Gemmatimonadota bacterium]